MKITVVGATGMSGSRIVAEATRRGHDVTGVSRSGTAVQADAHDRNRMIELFTDTDAIVAATRPAPGQESTVTTALLDAAAATDRRILIIGGAGPLRTPGRPDLLAVDNPDYVPPQWRTLAVASVAQLEACQNHPADWTYLSPPAILEPGTRSGTYRRGTTTLLTAPDGTSRISAEDLAVAVIDELENPSTARHFTVAY